MVINGSVRSAMPSTVWSLRLMWLTYAAAIEPVRIDSVAVVLGRDRHLPGDHVLHGVVSTAMPERQLEGARAERPGRHLVARGKCRGSALLPMSLRVSATIGSSSRGSPGPGERHDAVRPEGEQVIRARRRCGKTRTAQPRAASERMMFRFTPPSSSATR